MPPFTLQLRASSASQREEDLLLVALPQQLDAPAMQLRLQPTRPRARSKYMK